MLQYIGLIHKDAGSDYGVSFPDFPGVITAGKDLDDARAMAEEALALHIEGLVEDGEAIPEASSLEAVMADPQNRDGVAILVAANTDAHKSVRVNITLPADVLARIDKFARVTATRGPGFWLRPRSAIEEDERAADDVAPPSPLPKEIEIAALVGLQDVLHVEPRVAARRSAGAGLCVSLARRASSASSTSRSSCGWRR